MPSKVTGKGLSRFSGLSISEPVASEPCSRVSSETTSGESTGKSIETTPSTFYAQNTLQMAGPSSQSGASGTTFPDANMTATFAQPVQPMQFPAGQHAVYPFIPQPTGSTSASVPAMRPIMPVPSSQSGASGTTFPDANMIATFAQSVKPMQFPVSQHAVYPFIPQPTGSTSASVPAMRPIMPAPSAFKLPSTGSGYTPTSSRSVNHSTPSVTTPTSFTPPTAPSSFNGSAISSIQPSSSISARVEKSRKRKAEDDGRSSASGSMSIAKISTASSRKRKEAAAVGLMEDFIVNMNGEHRSRIDSFMKSQPPPSQAPPARPSSKPLNPAQLDVCRGARDKLLELDRSAVSPSDVILLMNHMLGDFYLADNYLTLTKDPSLAELRELWLRTTLDEIKHGT